MEAATDYITKVPRAQQDTRGLIRTFSGLYVNPLQLRAVDIRIQDIAHHLSQICRYTGACPHFYSVAQHSVYVSSLMWGEYGTPEAAMAGLLHDAAEAYFNDLASPVKHDPRMKWYRDLEHEATLMIFNHYGVQAHWLAKTKESDNTAFRHEVESWWGTQTLVVGGPPALEECVFRHEFSRLQKEMSK